jgi:hypothetical protein
MTDDPMDRFRRQVRLGPLALMRLRAEVLLSYAADDTIPLTAAEHEELERIAVAPKAEDSAFLASFDRYLTDDADDAGLPT